MKAKERAGHHICVSIGVGAAGEMRRRAFEAAAKAEGRSLSSWVTSVLDRALGLDGAPSWRQELAALEARVAELEALSKERTAPLESEPTTGKSARLVSMKLTFCIYCSRHHALEEPCTGPFTLDWR